MAADNADVSARAELCGVMVVTAVTAAVGKPKTLYIAGGFYSGGTDSTLGVFRYFNKFDHVIEPDTRWLIHATVASFDANSVSGAGAAVDSEAEFDVMGDIFYLSPAYDASAKHLPVVRVCGRPSNIVQETGSFDIDAHHWISFPNRKAMFPWSGTIPEGWTHKPIPNPNAPKFVSVSGTFTGMRTVGTSKRFHIDIAMVTFLGPAPPAPVAQALTPTPKGKRKAGINFDDKFTPTKKVART